MISRKYLNCVKLFEMYPRTKLRPNEMNSKFFLQIPLKFNCNLSLLDVREDSGFDISLEFCMLMFTTMYTY